MTREITDMKAFTFALESMGKDRFTIGLIPPTAGLVNQYFNDSTGENEEGDIDARGPWNEGGDWKFVEAPAFEPFKSAKAGTRESETDGDERHSSGHAKPGAPHKRSAAASNKQ